ncbi:hypothetical protein [Nostoc flagelliforme]
MELIVQGYSNNEIAQKLYREYVSFVRTKELNRL